MLWYLTDKGNVKCRQLADRHYSRQTIGAKSFTRPGHNYVLYTRDYTDPSQTTPYGEAVFVWWRPAWELNTKGTERFDKLRCLECTIFRNETRFLSSTLVIQAIAAVKTWANFIDTDLPDGLITGVNSILTTKQRSRNSQPGACFIHAGFEPLSTKRPNSKSTADTWLYIPTSHLNSIKPEQPSKLDYWYQHNLTPPPTRHT